MKTALRKALPLLLCLILCLGLTPAALAAEADEILITEDYEPYLPADDSVTFIFELSDAEVFDAAGDIVTISFDANGGTGTMASQDFVRGDAAKPLNPNTFTRDGYYFLGWNQRADGTANGGQLLRNGASIRLSEEASSTTLTLYAQWEEIGPEGLTVTVSFDPNGGTGTMAAQDFVRGDVPKPLNPNTFTRNGYTFTHWNTVADDSGTAYQNGARIAPSENMTLYAQWTDKVLVHYDPNGASGSRKAQWFTLGVPKKLGSIEAIGYVMDGYEFVGWAPVPDAAPNDPRIIQAGGEFTAEGETTLYAIWKKVPGIAIDKAHFPDDAFRSYVSANLDQNGDGELSKYDIDAVTQINVSGSYNEPGTIQSLEGIQYFTGLQNLNCSDNRLTSLELSSNTMLTSLRCSNNQLTSLDINNNTALTFVVCYGNQLTSLDLSCNTMLTGLGCSNNQLTSLDLSHTPLLSSLSCEGNPLSTLDIRQCMQLVELVENSLPSLVGYVQFRTGSNSLSYDYGVKLTPALDYGSGIVVDDKQFPDPSFLAYVKDLDIDGNGVLSDTEISSVAGINVRGLNITSLQGIELFPNLTSLYCSNNQLTSLSLNGNTALTSLSCDNNPLTSLDVSNNATLTYLNCSSNQLTNLDLHSNTALIYLRCANNRLTSLDLSQNTALMGLSCEGNYLTVLDLSNSSFLSMVCNASEPQYVDNTAEYHFKDYGTGKGPRSDSLILFYDIGTSIITAPGLVLPTALTEIGEEAFADSAFRYVIVPDTVTAISPCAFADCEGLAAVFIPSRTIEIAPNAFSGISNLVVVGTSDSAAHTFAQQRGFYYVEHFLH